MRILFDKAAAILGRSKLRDTSKSSVHINQQGFRLTHKTRETEERQREQENNDAKVRRFPFT